MDLTAILEKLLVLQRAYASTYRATITEERYQGLVESGLLAEYTLGSIAIREPLIEHVGHLPIIASYLHPSIDHRNDVDLGRALIMLSIHDIGETKVGDVPCYTKDQAHENSELEATRSLLSDDLFPYFEEFEKRETPDAKFAKSVDAIAPLFHGLLTPEITPARFAHYGFNTDRIVERKRPLFEWDAVLLGIFDHVIARYREIETKGE